MLIVVYEKDSRLEAEEIETQPGNETEAIREYKNMFPDKAIKYVFPKDSSLISDEQKQIKKFEEQCAQYGFNAKDYKTRFISEDTGDVYELIGFMPGHRDRTCAIRNENTGKIVAARPDYVKARIAKSTTIWP